MHARKVRGGMYLDMCMEVDGRAGGQAGGQAGSNRELLCVDMCADMRMDMHANMRQPCAAHQKKTQVGTVLTI